MKNNNKENGLDYNSIAIGLMAATTAVMGTYLVKVGHMKYGAKFEKREPYTTTRLVNLLDEAHYENHIEDRIPKPTKRQLEEYYGQEWITKSSFDEIEAAYKDYRESYIY